MDGGIDNPSRSRRGAPIETRSASTVQSPRLRSSIPVATSVPPGSDENSDAPTRVFMHARYSRQRLEEQGLQRGRADERVPRGLDPLDRALQVIELEKRMEVEGRESVAYDEVRACGAHDVLR